MKRYLSKVRRRRNRIILFVIILITVLLLRLINMSSENNLGMAKASAAKAIMSGICSGIIDKESATISYHLNKDKAAIPFPLNITSEIYRTHQFALAAMQKPSVVYNKSAEYLYKEDSEAVRGKIGFESYERGMLTKEYILSNGAFLNRKEYEDYLETNVVQNRRGQELPVSIMEGAIDYSEFDLEKEGQAVGVMKSFNGTPFTLMDLNDAGFLIRNFYIVDPSTNVTDELFDAEELLGKDMTMQTSNGQPQILIYHTHSQEAFLDSRPGIAEDTVVGIGDLLAELLEEEYGYYVIHDRSVYDLVDGKLDRNKAYNYAREGVLKILEENPSIEVIIDLHRDGADKRSTVIDGQETAQVMLLNGLSRSQSGPNTRLDNPNIKDNLAFSLKLHLKSLELYPGLFYKNYLQAYRYNLDLRPKCLLVELGTHKNTLRSAKKAMEPFAKVLDAVLKGQ